MDVVAGENPMVGAWWRPSVFDIRPGLENWLHARLGEGLRLEHVELPEDGFSSLNVIMDISGSGPGGLDLTGRYVARLEPPASAFPMFPETDLSLQRRCMDLVASSTTAPTPRVLWHETERGFVGSPFLVMTHLPGASWPSNPPYTCSGWILDASPARRAAMQSAVVAAIARVHGADEEKVDLAFLRRPEWGAAGPDQYVGYTTWYYDWARAGRSYPIVEESIAWLEANKPEVSGPLVLNWGDARPGNILFRDGAVCAVLDWEMASVGPPEVDLGFLVLMHKYFDRRATSIGLPGLPELFRVDDVRAQYAIQSGRRLGDLTWYEMLAAVRISIHHVRQIARAVAFGRIDEEGRSDQPLGASAFLEGVLRGVGDDRTPGTRS
jgi:aminoglycoside phosphotransferase (APT) family kinase protein